MIQHIRSRMRGDRRRGSIESLVRTRPTARKANEVIPAYPGAIWRHYFPTAIADDAGIATDTWSTGGTTGTATNFNCISYYYLIPDRSVADVRIMSPIRWSPGVSASNGQPYDAWQTNSANNWRYLNQTPNNNTTVLSNAVGQFGITDTLIPAGSHVQWLEYAENITGINLYCDVGLASGFNFANIPTYNSLDPGVQVRTTGITYGAIRHVINGVPGPVIMNPTVGAGDFRFVCSPGDIYEMDVWYKSNHNAVVGNTDPYKVALFLITSQVSNSSKRSGLKWMQFQNANYASAFNPSTHTYEVTVAGQSGGWTLEGGSNGPHKMETAGVWTRTYTSGTGSLVWTNSSGSTRYLTSIELIFAREIAHVQVIPGSVMGSSWRPTYRPASTGEYRTSTTATEAGGTITHAPNGLFNQGGTTVFNLVTDSLGVNLAGAGPEGRQGVPLVFTHNFPTSITLTRVAL